MLITLIMVSYNTRELSVSALESAHRSWADLEVIVVDNASQDGSADWITAAFPDATVIANQENVGFARAVNQALALATGDFVLLLNPDCDVEPSCLPILVLEMEQHPAVGIAAPLTRHPDARLKVLSAGFEPTARAVFAHYSGLSRLRRVLPMLRGWHILAGVDDDRMESVDWVSGSCMLIRADVLRSIGGFSERWFMYAEDIEFCHRARGAGWTVVHVPEAEALHLVGAATNVAEQRVRTMWLDSLADYYDETLSTSRLSSFTWRVTLAGGLVSRSLAYRLRAVMGRGSSQIWAGEARKFRSFARAAITAGGSA